MLSDTEPEMPTWKKELILRRRSKSSTTAQLVAPQTSTSTKVHQPNSTCSSSSSPSRQQHHQQELELSSPTNGSAEPRLVNVRCDLLSIKSAGDKMVQERIWSDRDEETSETSNDFDSSEELKYGPGIVSKLKNRYLSLTLRETMKTRPSILTMRKATSLEHILDDNEEDELSNNKNKNLNHQFSTSNGYSKQIPNRYKSAAKKPDMKRARSVEYISSNASSNIDNLMVDVKPKRESLHEDMLDANRKEEVDKKNEINDIKTFSNNLNTKVNRPKRIQPIMAEKEKPPFDVVNQTKKMFERPELRTKAPLHTGEVAAKVATFKDIIQTKKPVVKQKPILPIPAKKEVEKMNTRKNKSTPNVPTLRSPEPKVNKTLSSPIQIVKKPIIENLPSQIPDVSLVQNQQNNETRKSSLTDTPDLIVHSSPKPQIEDIKEIKIQRNGFSSTEYASYSSSDDETKISNRHQDDDVKTIPKNQNFGNPLIFDFSSKPKIPNHLPVSHDNNQKTAKLKRSSPVTSTNHQKLPPKSRQKPPPPPPLTQPLTVNVPIEEPLKIEITTTPPIINNKILSPPPPERNDKVVASEKLENLKNIVKNSEVILEQCSPKKVDEKVVEKVDVKIVDSAKKNKDDVPVFKVLKRIPRKQEQQNCLVFDFTTRKEVPDYVANDVRVPKMQKVKKPKTGEAGIILLPGATWESTSLDVDDDDWEKSLDGPPSPLLVTFVNDNVVIDGKSSLNQKKKKPKMSIKFVESEPDVFFYPSESSIIIGDENPTTQLATNSKSSVGHSVPSLSGCTLATYKSKTANQIEDFQLGMKPTTITSPSSAVKSPETTGNEDEKVLNDENFQPIAFSAGNNTTDILF
nr:uncharacterized protein DDB_G0284459 [Onthophagus taurus]